uniref:Uncharacterized protein n=1 Tax=Variovorax paradoxus (strain S110) TaxID=543728 RepID=C5CMH0_VARPS
MTSGCSGRAPADGVPCGGEYPVICAHALNKSTKNNNALNKSTS